MSTNVVGNSDMVEPHILQEISLGVWKVLCQKENSKIKRRKKEKSQRQKQKQKWWMKRKSLMKRKNCIWDPKDAKVMKYARSECAYALYDLGVIK